MNILGREGVLSRVAEIYSEFDQNDIEKIIICYGKNGSSKTCGKHCYKYLKSYINLNN